MMPKKIDKKFFPTNDRPLFVAIEGYDYTGKTKLAKQISARFSRLKGKFRYFNFVRWLWAQGERRDPTQNEGESIFRQTTARFYDEKVRPALDAGASVVCDGYFHILNHHNLHDIYSNLQKKTQRHLSISPT